MKWIFVGMLIWISPDGYAGKYDVTEVYQTQEECRAAMEEWADWAESYEDDLVDWEASCHNEF